MGQPFVETLHNLWYNRSDKILTTVMIVKKVKVECAAVRGLSVFDARYIVVKRYATTVGAFLKSTDS